jgi:hypothetical protein
MSDREADAGEVGYGRPPKQHQFKKGRSGNPKGRSKRDQHQPSFVSLIYAALNEYVTVQEGGQRKKIKKLVAAAKQLANKAVSGDYRAVKLLIELTNTPAWADATYPREGLGDARERIEAMIEGMAKKFEAEEQSRLEGKNVYDRS